jgi:hypothetical protein
LVTVRRSCATWAAPSNPVQAGASAALIVRRARRPWPALTQDTAGIRAQGSFMWHPGHPAAGQCEGCTYYTTQVGELSHLHSRGITFAVFCQGPYGESIRYRDFMGWDIPWYSAQDSRDALLASPKRPGRMHVVCYLRDGDRVFETYWTTLRGVETMDCSYALTDLTAYGLQEPWEDSPPGWPQQCSYIRTDGGPPDWPPVSEWPGGRPIAQWPRIEAGRSDDLSAQP